MVVANSAELFTDEEIARFQAAGQWPPQPAGIILAKQEPTQAGMAFVLAQQDLQTRLYLLREEAFSAYLPYFDQDGNFLG